MGLSVLLIYPDPDEEKDCRFGYSLPLLYLGAILRQGGHECQLLDFSLEPISADVFKAKVAWADVVLMEFDAFPLKRAANSVSGIEIVRAIRGMEVPVIAFGRNCTIRQKPVPGATFTYFTEPEPTILVVVKALAQGESPPSWINESAALHDLDLLPLPARDLLPDAAMYGQTKAQNAHLARSALVETSRGCLNTCRFCQRQGWSINYRTHSIEYSLSEFESLARGGYENVWISDDNFTFNVPRSKALLRALGASGVTRGLNLALSSWTRIDFETLQVARTAGVRIISFGIESADPAIMEFYDKRIDLAHTRELIRFADNLGIYTVANIIVGAPSETEATMRSTFDYVLSVPFDEVNAKILNYMPGAQLYSRLPVEMRSQGRDFFACVENGLCSFSMAELRLQCQNFTRVFKAARFSRLRSKMLKEGAPYAVLKRERD